DLPLGKMQFRKKQQYGMIQELLKESNCLREELHNLRCLTQIKAEERGQKHRERGIQLLEHEEVLFSYYEKVNIQEAAVTKGNMALESLEKDMRDLQLAINEEKRRTELKKKEVPLKKKLEEDITMLQIEVGELTRKDKTIERLNGTVEYKALKGKDPSPVELVKKIEQLEVNLAERERQVLEKELLVDQLTRLSKPLSEQAESCQQDKLSLAKKLNELRAHIIDTNHRMMAATAELSMKQAVTLALQQEIKEKELCQQQLEQGLPPCPEMEEEWKRMLREKKRRQRNKEERERLAEEVEWTQLPNGEYTTAEIRPNAYIPENDTLRCRNPMGPRPLQTLPTRANMRHIRKPALKSLET
uniref:Coiled-coil domain containing 146 n=1 Tax=Labrus bergylta TaxID=56723 RepID=A0A3Q3E5G4_9LABR